MFGMMRDFDEDPFFSHQQNMTGHREHVRRMERMMDNFMSPFDMFSDMGFPRLMGAPAIGAPDPASGQVQPGRRPGQHRQNMLAPFGFNHNLMIPDMRGMFTDMVGDNRLAQEPNCHSYASSSVFTYSTGDDGQPKVYQASTTTTTAPGGVKEVRKTIADSEAGVKKMAIGRHLDDRAHIVEKTQYVNSGQNEENQEFINLEEEEADVFNREWQNRAQNRNRVYEVPAIAHNAAAARHRRPYDEGMRALPAPRKRDLQDSGDDSGENKTRRRHHYDKNAKHGNKGNKARPPAAAPPGNNM